MDDWTRIARYLDAEEIGTLSSEEEEAFHHWLSAHPGRKKKLKAARAIWGSASAEDLPSTDAENAPQSRFDVEAAWAQVAARIGLSVEHTAANSDSDASREPVSPSGAPHRSRRSPRQLNRSRTDRTRSRLSKRRWGTALAAVLIMAGLIGYVGATRVGAPGEEAPAEPSVVHTAEGQRATIRLADGSTVTLAPDSELRYPDPFSDSTRSVTLRGQAFFEVAPEAARPFRIRARKTTTEVLGTSFSIEAYPETAALRVVVAEGQVSVTDERSRDVATISRGEIATVSDGEIATAFAQDLDALLAWRDARLHFRQTPLPAVLRTLERWYAVDVALDDSSLSQRRLTTTFDGESLAEALEVLRLSLDVPIQQSDSTVIVAPSGTRPPRP